SVIRQLSGRNLSVLPSGALQEIASALTALEQLIKKVREFNLDGQSPQNTRKSLIGQVSQQHEQIVRPLLLPLAFTATLTTDYAHIEREAKGHLATVREDTAAAVNSLKE